MDCLPDQVLSLVLERAGLSQGPAFTLVCKRWRHLLFTAPGLWREFTIQAPRRLPGDAALSSAERAQWEDVCAALLSRVASMVETLIVPECHALEHGGGGQLARFLRCLAPAAARNVRLSRPIGRMPEDAMAALVPLTGLTRLQLSWTRLPANAASVLRQLSALRSFELNGDDVPLDCAAVLPQLVNLTELQLLSNYPLPPFDWRRLTALTQLQRLLLYQTYTDDMQLQAPSPAAFAALTDFDFFADAWAFQLAGAEMRQASYETTRRDDEDEDMSEDDEGDDKDQPTHFLYLLDVQRLDSLCMLLDALLTPRTPLRRLSFGANIPLTPAAVLGCRKHLEGLTSLDLWARGLTGQAAGVSVPALGALLEQAPLLADIAVSGLNVGGPLPFCLADRAWRSLRLLWRNRITDLPEGPYLSGLEDLTLTERDLPGLPASLSSATCLTSLDLSYTTAVRLATAAEWDACLSPLSRLRNLNLNECELTDLPAFGQLSALTCLYARKNKFEGLPPALGAATGLVALDLSGCPSLRLTTSDLDSLLASMPHLRHLMLGGSMTKEGNAHLKQVAQLKQLKQDRYSL